MCFSELLHGFFKIYECISLSCYMDLLKLLLGFVKLVRCFSWVRCAFGNILVLIWCTVTWSSHLSFTSPLALAGCIIGSHRQQQDRALIDRYNQPRQAGPTGPLYKGSIQHGKYRFRISKDLGQTKMSLFCRYCDPILDFCPLSQCQRCFFLMKMAFSAYFDRYFSLQNGI